MTAVNAVIHDELFDWNRDPEQPDEECKGEVGRLRLTGKDQIIVTRVGELLRRTLTAQ